MTGTDVTGSDVTDVMTDDEDVVDVSTGIDVLLVEVGSGLRMLERRVLMGPRGSSVVELDSVDELVASDVLEVTTPVGPMIMVVLADVDLAVKESVAVSVSVDLELDLSVDVSVDLEVGLTTG